MINREFPYHLGENKELVDKFIYTFMRFEYSLKSAGFIKQHKNDCSADWNKFARDIAPNFTPSNPTVKESVEELLRFPPRKQVVRDGELVFEESQYQNISDVEKLSLSIRRARNNLLHGGKFLTERSLSRDFLLIKYCLNILEEWVSLNENVYRKFNEY